MVNWTLQVLGFVPNAFMVYSNHLLRHKRKLGWILGLVSILAWALFDSYVAAWSAIFWCVVIAVQMIHGWWKWHKDEASADPLPVFELGKGSVCHHPRTCKECWLNDMLYGESFYEVQMVNGEKQLRHLNPANIVRWSTDGKFGSV